MSSADTPRRPRLEVALEALGDTYSRLAAASATYQQARGLLAQLTATPDASIEDAGLLLVIGELQLPVQLPADPQQRLALLEDAVHNLGTEVVRLWHSGFDICKDAVEHCDAAAAAARAAQPGK